MWDFWINLNIVWNVKIVKKVNSAKKMALNGVKHVKKLLKKHRIFVKIEIYKTMNAALNNGK